MIRSADLGGNTSREHEQAAERLAHFKDLLKDEPAGEHQAVNRQRADGEQKDHTQIEVRHRLRLGLRPRDALRRNRNIPLTVSSYT